jgi:hypothetical protein
MNNPRPVYLKIVALLIRLARFLNLPGAIRLAIIDQFQARMPHLTHAVFPIPATSQI